MIVVGLGYVGLPLVHRAAEVGIKVTGLDLDDMVVAELNAGRSHVDDLSDQDVEAALGRGFRATTDTSVVAEADVVVICVPTPLSPDGGPDLGAVLAASASVGQHLKPGCLVVLESTTYPGTTDEMVRPILERESGLTAGVDFQLGYSPERIDPGNATYGLVNTPKIVGADDPASRERIAEFYGLVVDSVVHAKGTREAEAAKLLENTYRHVNIALMNEMAQAFHDLDVDLWDVIDLAATKPFGFQAFYPGPGVGGHCIPIDPSYLSHRVRTQLGRGFRMIELAQEINELMPTYVARRVQDQLNRAGKSTYGSKVLLLGVTYKADIADERESPALDVAKKLLALGAVLSYHDPYVSDWSVKQAARVDDVLTGAGEADIVVLLVNHREYDTSAIAAVSPLMLDTRGVVGSSDVERL
ncbi:nucleotide sugar dehydrogenase [Nocardioides guangzhouensis]|uniref:nucleotide sugar dehydrogenase n=1 Tax=Nocardioides guangzhouensis TaxID=2497878 RepID=UPI001C37AAC1|nr:nucleotide sugar dehydrogenase [Nocardioides guangzhouensis]